MKWRVSGCFLGVCVGVGLDVAAETALPVAIVGEVTPRSAVVWVRADDAETLQLVLTGGAGHREAEIRVDAARDHTGRIRLDSLTPAQTYEYHVVSDRGASPTGRFRTAPPPQDPAPIHFAFGGDVGGQNVCRDAAEGMPIFAALARGEYDFFVGLGDMIYADNACEPVGLYRNRQVPGDFGPAMDVEGFRAHWRYNRADAGLRALLRATSYYAMWDDHEVLNDFGPHHDRGAHAPGVSLLPLGLQAFLDHNPVSPPAQNPTRLYRSARWGKHAELFFLDTRQYRDANSARDDAERPKTLLGSEQLAWLRRSLAESDATWQIVATSVPLAIPTGAGGEVGRDGWAGFDQPTGFERELHTILEVARVNRRRLLFLTTDVHFATGFRYRPFGGDFVFHELVAGPMNAGVFPRRVVDGTLRPERLFFYGPERAEEVSSWQGAKRWFNYGFVQIDAGGSLRFGIRDVEGRPVYETALSPSP